MGEPQSQPGHDRHDRQERSGQDRLGARVSHRTWGEEFFVAAVSQERVLRTIDTLVGQPISLGPLPVGPRGIATLRARGSVRAGAAEQVRTEDPSAPVAFHVTLPVQITFEVDLGVEVQHFSADLTVPLTLTALALERLRIWIDVVPPKAEDVVADVRAEGLRASILGRVAGVEGELRSFAARYVMRELGKPHVRQVRLIDVRELIDLAWEPYVARSLPVDGADEDLSDALAREVTARESALETALETSLEEEATVEDR